MGQLLKKQIHSAQSSGTYPPFIQKTDFEYNIRGWLTSINDPDSNANENDIFAMKLHYYDVMTGSTDPVQYNGNISSVNWATNLNSLKSAYVYAYDSLNRITKAEYYHGTEGAYAHDGSFDEKNIGYDENGNIKSLHRYGANNLPIDQLSYNYFGNGNLLKYIIDPTGDVPGVVDYPGGTAIIQGFNYDLNGNMTHSSDKGINSIRYSYLNKPEELDFGNGEKIDYIYDGVGNKLAKIVMDGNALPGSSLIYAGNFVYNLSGVLQYIMTSEGRLIPENGTYRFEYFMKDHLGSTRATYTGVIPGLAQVAEYQHYYPFGMQVESLCYTTGADLPNNRLYNGKELQTDYNLQWYDYGARYYDPQIARWTTPDPLSEANRKWSPYRFAYDNPMRFLDPDGMLEGDYYNKNGSYLGTDNIDDKKVYVADSKNADGSFSNAKALSVTHDVLQLQQMWLIMNHLVIKQKVYG